MPSPQMPASQPELRAARVYPLDDLEVRESGAGSEYFTVSGHAAVFNSRSHDLGGFREVIEPGAFTRVLADAPDVHLVVGHDMNRPLARTRNATLELAQDERGLRMWARVKASTTYARDTLEAMRDGLMDGASFAFSVDREGQDWDEDEGGELVRTIRSFSGLFDVSVVAQGAYPEADAQAARSLLRAAARDGLIPEKFLGRIGENPVGHPGSDALAVAEPVAPDSPVGRGPSNHLRAARLRAARTRARYGIKEPH